MHLFFEPMDVWLFRDGRPFNAADDHRAEGMFPPYPSVIQGAIRSHRLVQRNVDLHDKQAIINEVGTHDKFGALRLRGPLLARRNDDTVTCYFPLPADVARYKSAFHVLIPESVPDLEKEDTPYRSSAIYDTLLMPPGKPEKLTEAMGQWIDQRALLDYVAGKSFTATRTNSLYITESRPGIGMNHSQRVTKEGLLYEVAFVRTLPQVGLYIELEGYSDWKTHGVLRIGGESRAARYDKITQPNIPWAKAGETLPKHFKLYFVTPTYFSEGIVPQKWDQFFSGKVRLRTVALNKYDSIGGYDLANDLHKPARRFVPAGSVYYFTCEDENITLKSNPTTDAHNDFVTITEYGAEIGFGHFFIANWKGV